MKERVRNKKELVEQGQEPGSWLCSKTTVRSDEAVRHEDFKKKKSKCRNFYKQPSPPKLKKEKILSLGA